MLVKRQKAAGGVVLRSLGAIEVREVLLVQHREARTWGFPKGHIDPGESPDVTALREVEEETGVIGEIITSLPSTRYQFTNRAGIRIYKSVDWFLMKHVGDGAQTHAHEIADLAWMSVDDAYRELDFDENRKILRVALSLTDQSDSA